MTNQEAITKLTNILNDDTYSWHPAHAEALEMAVDALKGADGDCISRQAVIDAIGERPLLWTGGDYELGCANQYDLDRLAIETVPSAQPEACEDAVSRRAVVSRIADLIVLELEGNTPTWNEVYRAVGELPSAQPEIIRCKDCKHYKYSDNRAFGFPVKRCEWTGFEDVDDDFCSRAERRTDG